MKTLWRLAPIKGAFRCAYLRSLAVIALLEALDAMDPRLERE